MGAAAVDVCAVDVCGVVTGENEMALSMIRASDSGDLSALKGGGTCVVEEQVVVVVRGQVMEEGAGCTCVGVHVEFHSGRRNEGRLRFMGERDWRDKSRELHGAASGETVNKIKATERGESNRRVLSTKAHSGGWGDKSRQLLHG